MANYSPSSPNARQLLTSVHKSSPPKLKMGNCRTFCDSLLKIWRRFGERLAYCSPNIHVIIATFAIYSPNSCQIFSNSPIYRHVRQLFTRCLPNDLKTIAFHRRMISEFANYSPILAFFFPKLSLISRQLAVTLNFFNKGTVCDKFSPKIPWLIRRQKFANFANWLTFGVILANTIRSTEKCTPPVSLQFPAVVKPVILFIHI